MIGIYQTVRPENVEAEMDRLMEWYHGKAPDIAVFAEFHARYESIHPFQDGNGRTYQPGGQGLADGIQHFVEHQEMSVHFLHVLRPVIVLRSGQRSIVEQRGRLLLCQRAPRRT